ncbi:MAG: hypothetical protein P1V36_05435 [Planctomycetota bacterium]|nr:hypothetical protein [Planctomycetota bacterium]
MSRRGLCLVLLLGAGLLASCGAESTRGGARVRELHDGPGAVRPFTLEERRAGTVVGQETLSRVVTGDVTYSRSRVLAVDETGYRSENTLFLEDMTPLLEPSERRAEFADEVAWSSYRPGSVTMETVTLTTELGTFECWHLHTENEQGWTEDAWFAKDLPGRAILLETRTRSGTRLRRVERVKDSRVAAKPAATTTPK